MWILLLNVAAAQAFIPNPDAQIPLGSTPYGVRLVFGDIDGDGLGDLAWALDGELRMAPGVAGAAPLGADVAIPLGGEVVTQIAIADLDADGLDDVLAVVAGDGWRGWSGADLAADPSWDLSDTPISATGLGDVNGDGGADLAIGNQVWLSSPAGPVAGPVLVDVSQLYDVGDVNGDGYADVAGPDPLVVGWGGETEGPIRLYLGGPNGPSVTPLWSYQDSGQTGWAVTMADVDGDGTTDLVSACLTVYDEAAAGNLIALGDLANPAGPTLLSTNRLEFDIGQGFAIATLDDRDGDGADDVVMAISGLIREIPWSQAGFDFWSQTAEQWIGSPLAIMSLFTADVGGGGRDLVVAWYSDNTSDLTVWLGSPAPPTDSGDTGIPSTDTDTTDTDQDTQLGNSGQDPAHKPAGCGCDVGGAAGTGWLLIVGAAFLGRRRGSDCGR